jgi:hypothetical protein
MLKMVSINRPVPPLPKFVRIAASPARTSEAKGALATYDSSAAFRVEVPKRARGKGGRNFNSAALVLGIVVVSSLSIGYAIGAQPHMEAAIGFLQSARAELAAATPNKGGHRARALALVDQAIGEVREGIRFAAGR